MTASHIARSRWHLEAPRQIVDCGCLWVIPRAGARYRSYWCLAHRWTRGEALAKRRETS